MTPTTPPATLDAAGIAARVPHSGSMCLLHSLLVWSPSHIVCTATSHRLASNPLRLNGQLCASNAVEYAAQAMALHGGLCAELAASNGQEHTPPSAGFLASVRGVVLHVARLDDVPGALQVQVTKLAGDTQQAMYSFVLQTEGGALLVEGRATVVLAATAPLG
jgi:predicted hotdog family 3-hydroxylacyl-ACP dehydratase